MTKENMSISKVTHLYLDDLEVRVSKEFASLLLDPYGRERLHIPVKDLGKVVEILAEALLQVEE